MLLRRLRWLVAIRLLLLASLTLLYMLLRLLPAVPIAEIEASNAVQETTAAIRTLDTRLPAALVTFGYVISLVWIGFLRLGERYATYLAHGQFLGDIALITGFVYYFGGVASPFSILYLVVIAVAATLLRRRASLLVAAEAYVLYAALLVSLFAGWIEPPNSAFTETVSLWRLEYNLVTHLLGFFGVAQLVSSLAASAARAEQELEERRDEIADLEIAHRDVIQSIPSGLVTTDAVGRIVGVNRVGERILGVTEALLRGHHVRLTGLFDDEAWNRACSAEEHARREVALAVGSERRWVGYTVTSLSDSHGNPRGFVVVFQDLTDWQRLQEELRLKDRMAAVGEMAAGLAHEIGNPLAAISGSVQMLHSGANESQRQKLLEIVLRESDRLDRTVKDFLRFARPRPPAPVPFDVARLLADETALLRNSRDLDAGHQVVLELDPASATIVADADQISQVFWNLVRNALKAMPKGGTLTICGTLEAAWYTIEVVDTGMGMGEDQQRRIFQPFTSFFDQGSGVGMAIVYRIIEEHHGRLGVISSPGAGTTIRVALPRTEPSEQPR